MPGRGLKEGETEGLVSGDAGTGVEEDTGVVEGDAPDPETAVSVGVGSGELAGGGEEDGRVTGDDGAGETVPKSVGEDGPGPGAGTGTVALPHVLLCVGQLRAQLPLVIAS